LTRLESTDEGPRKPLRAFPIANRRVSEVLELLEGLLDAGVLEQSAKRAAEPTDPGVQGATASIPASASISVPVSAPRTTPEVTLAADEATSRILAFGEARLLDELGRLIDELDVREAQVLIEALVVTLTESQTRALAVELQSLATVGTTSARFASIFGQGSIDPATSTIPAVTAPGFSAVVLDPGDFSAVVRALETLNRGRSLTTPKVLVNNNVQATLDATLQTPYASTNASTTVATTSFGGTLDAGTRVTVKPQVADGDQIVIEYSVSLSSFVGEAADPALPPRRQETRLASVVTIPDGFTVVVGGLEIETEGVAESRVPWLGDIPIVGALFKERSRTTTKSRFFVFLRCSVMRSVGFEDLKYASDRDVALAGVGDGFPVLEPRVIR
jgi:general secretion pathway protein D